MVSKVKEQQQGQIELKKTITLFNGITILVGCIIGSGIFVSPKGVQERAGSVGLSLIIWIICGIFSGIGAYCFAELGTLLKSNGGDYYYVKTAFGPVLGFVRLWIVTMIGGFRPCMLSVLTLTFAVYTLKPFYPHCDTPLASTRLLSAICIVTLAAINCMGVKWATRVQDILTIGKFCALGTIILTGVVRICLGKTEHLSNMFDGTTTNVGDICLAFYSGLFAYVGWNALNFLVEEMINPERDLPIAIVASLGIVTFLHTMAIVAFYTAISPSELLETPAVAVLFANKLYGYMAWCMPLFVALSTLTSANGSILTLSRLFMVGAREGHMPEMLSLLHINKRTPVPAVMASAAIGLVYSSFSDNLYTLIGYVQIACWSAIGITIAALLWLRRKMPDADRPIKVWTPIPVIFMLACCFLVVVPIITAPADTGIGFMIILSSLPVYYLCVHRTWFHKISGCTTIFVQKIILALPETKVAS